MLLLRCSCSAATHPRTHLAQPFPALNNWPNSLPASLPARLPCLPAAACAPTWATACLTSFSWSPAAGAPCSCPRGHPRGTRWAGAGLTAECCICCIRCIQLATLAVPPVLAPQKSGQGRAPAAASPAWPLLLCSLAHLALPRPGPGPGPAAGAHGVLLQQRPHQAPQVSPAHAVSVILRPACLPACLPECACPQLVWCDLAAAAAAAAAPCVAITRSQLSTPLHPASPGHLSCLPAPASPCSSPALLPAASPTLWAPLTSCWRQERRPRWRRRRQVAAWAPARPPLTWRRQPPPSPRRSSRATAGWVRQLAAGLKTLAVQPGPS